MAATRANLCGLAGSTRMSRRRYPQRGLPGTVAWSVPTLANALSCTDRAFHTSNRPQFVVTPVSFETREVTEGNRRPRLFEII